MAFRHGNHGTITQQSVIWTCPTCGSENAGRLEDGCPSCKAGADAAKAQGSPRTANVATAFDVWIREQFPKGVDTSHLGIAELAWEAGVAWAQQQPAVAPIPITREEHAAMSPTGGWMMLMAKDAVQVEVNEAVRGTIVAALAFYRDNQLAYGSIPGQLSAQECTELITQLSPSEEEAPQ